MKKIILGIIVLLVIIVLVIIFGSTKSATAPIIAPITEPITNEDVKTVITYTDEGFNPSGITVKQGAIVTFENKSSNGFWPASNDHPKHLIYPEFDSKKNIPSGESYTFTFDKIGTWEYHNHLKTSQKGTITVE